MLRPPTVTASDSGLRRAPPHDRAVHLAHVALDLLARPVRLRFAVTTLEPGHDALVVGLVGADPVEAVLVRDVDRLGARPVEHELLVLGLELLPGRVDGEAGVLGHPGLEAGEVFAPGPGPGSQGALGQRERVVGHDQLGVDLVAGAQPGTGGAGPVGGVEGEVAGCRLLEADAAVGTGQVLGEGDGLVGLGLGSPRSFMTSTSAVPPVRSRAASIDSVRRWRTLPRRMSRSTTTSMVWVS